MPHSFDVFTESSAKVDEIHAAFGREDYWLARLSGDAITTLDSLVVDTDGTVAMRATQHLGRQLLPALVANIVPGELKLTHSETWQPLADGRVRGEISVLASGGLGSSRAENWLAPKGTGSQMRSTVRVQVKIPLVGGRLEKTIAVSLADSVVAVTRFTTTWIAEHA
jgi:hypothetical protein